jgi:hypothetical protein
MPGARRTVRPVLAVAVTERALLRELSACSCGPGDLVAAPRPEGSRAAGRGRPTAAESAGCPPPRPGSGDVAPPGHAISWCSRVFASEPGRGRTAVAPDQRHPQAAAFLLAGSRAATGSEPGRRSITMGMPVRPRGLADVSSGLPTDHADRAEPVGQELLVGR